MPFETFPIPGDNAKVDELISRIAEQHAQLMPVVTKLYSALNGRVQQQQQTLNKITGKLQRAMNGRIKQQGGALDSVAGKLYSALDGRIVEQGRQLDLQSALLPRLAPPQESQTAAPHMSGYPSYPTEPPSGGAGQTPLGPTALSLPAGVNVPPFSLSPAQVIPASAPPIQVTSTQSLGGTYWAVVLDCDKKTFDVYDLSKIDNPWAGGKGAFVPIRYALGPESLRDNWLGETNEYNVQHLSEWITIACHARETNGEGWPYRGDFPHEGVGGLDMGIPVGDWPFDVNGLYVGL